MSRQFEIGRANFASWFIVQALSEQQNCASKHELEATPKVSMPIGLQDDPVRNDSRYQTATYISCTISYNIYYIQKQHTQNRRNNPTNISIVPTTHDKAKDFESSVPLTFRETHNISGNFLQDSCKTQICDLQTELV